MKYLFIFATLLLIPLSVIAVEDLEGSQDTQVIGRIPGSYISQYFISDYADVTLPLSANTREKRDDFKRFETSGTQQIVIYTLPETVTNSVARAYSSILEEVQAGEFKTLFSCKSWKDECGYFFPRKVLIDSRPKTVSNTYHYGLGNSKNYNKSAAEFAMILGETTVNNQKTYLLVVVGKSRWDSEVQYSYEVITEEKMQTITLTEAAMRTDIESEGRVVLSGLYFDNAKSSLRDDSLKALKTIAQFIKGSPANYLVVGHTDYNGDFLSNQTLSEARAKTVVDTLVKQFGIDKTLLRAIGVGYASPFTSNLSNDGRAQNRRVELVLSGPD